MNIIDELEGKILELRKEIDEIQNCCSHPKSAVTKVYGSSTGGYDYPDEYWTDFKCSLCKKTWTEDGTK